MQFDSLKDVLGHAQQSNDHGLWLETAKELILYTSPLDLQERAETDELLARSLVAMHFDSGIPLERRVSISEFALYLPFSKLINSLNVNEKPNWKFLSILATIPPAHVLLNKILPHVRGDSGSDLFLKLDTAVPEAGPNVSTYRLAVDLFRFESPFAEVSGYTKSRYKRSVTRRLSGLFRLSNTSALANRVHDFSQLFDLLVEAETLPRRLRYFARSNLARVFCRWPLPSLQNTGQQELALTIARQIRTKMLIKELNLAKPSTGLHEFGLWLVGNPLAHTFLRTLIKRSDSLSLNIGRSIREQQKQQAMRTRLATVQYARNDLESAVEYLEKWQANFLLEHITLRGEIPKEQEAAKEWLLRYHQEQSNIESGTNDETADTITVANAPWRQILRLLTTGHSENVFDVAHLPSEAAVLSENGALRIALASLSDLRNAPASLRLKFAKTLQAQGFEFLTIALVDDQVASSQSAALLYGRALDKLKSPEERIAIWRLLLKHHLSPAFQVSYAAALVDGLCFQEAEAVMAEMVEQSKGQPSVHRNRILMLSRQGELVAAQKVAIDLAQQFPDSKVAQGDLFRTSLETGTPVDPLAEEVIVNQNNVNLFRTLSDRQIAVGEISAAMKLRKQVAEHTHQVNDYHRQLNAIFAAGEFDAASGFCGRLKQRFPGAPVFWKKAGQVCERRRDYEGMLDNFTEMLALNPADESARSAIARALIYLERNDDVIEWLNACELDRDENAWTFMLRGFFHARQGESSKAKHSLDQLYDLCAGVMAAQLRGTDTNPCNTYLLNGEYKVHPSENAAHVYRNFYTWLQALSEGSNALIGNSPSLLKNRHGATIDGFATVIRLNDFVIEGYERDLGTKTDYWYSSANRQASPHRPSVQQAKTLLMQPHARQFPDIAAFSKGRLGFELAPEDSGYLAPCVKMMSEHLSYPFPSTGFRMIQILEFLVQQPFTAFGFDFFSSGEMHYFDTGETHLQVGEVHAIDFEKDLVEQLIVPHGRHAKFV